MSNKIGFVRFEDGYTEDILFYKRYDTDLTLIEFFTASGQYVYMEYLATNLKNQTYKAHLFYTRVLSADDFGYVEDRLLVTEEIKEFVLFDEED